MTATEMLFDTSLLAPAWLAVQQFSAKDESPSLHRTVCVEEYVDGVRLVATDRYVVLTAWVPALDKDAPEPDVDAAPVAVHVARDVNKRGGGLLAYLLSLAAEDDAPRIPVRMSFVEVVPDEDVPMFTGMEGHGVRLEHPGVEQVTLETSDLDFPAWRSLFAGFKTINTTVIGLNPEILGRLAKAGKFFPEAALEWQWGGPDKPARIAFVSPGVPTVVSGLVMPVRLWTEKKAESAA